MVCTCDCPPRGEERILEARDNNDPIGSDCGHVSCVMDMSPTHLDDILVFPTAHVYKHVQHNQADKVVVPTWHAM